MIEVDLDATTLRDLNARLHALPADTNETRWRVINPKGRHAIACGLTQSIDLLVDGHAGYYCAGMNEAASVEITGQCGWGVAENMMSGLVRVRGDASQSAGASGHGGLLVIEGDAAARCGISMKGIEIVVGGSIGHMGAFMGQAGTLLVMGDAGDGLGDSLYEATLFVGGAVKSLGADCEEKEMTDADRAAAADLLARAGLQGDVSRLRKYGSARRLYNFNIDHAGAY